MRIGIIREGKNPPDKRVPLTPAQCREVEEKFPGTSVVVQPSPIRAFPDAAYRDAGVNMSEDLSDCNILMGVKEVPIPELVSDKTYFFFSHTIKEQPYNRDLMRTILDRNIRMIDYETLVGPRGNRLIGFGRYAGIVGAYNGFLAYGKRTGAYDLKPAHECEDRVELEEELKKVKLPPIKIALTGRGRVAGGAIEILEALGIQKVEVEDYLTKTYDQPVYTQLWVIHYNKSKPGAKGTVQDFFENPQNYESNFMRFARISEMYISGHFWDSNAPFLFTREDARDPEFKIEVVADISCDIDGPVASTIRPSTIADPLYGYDPQTESEVAYNQEGAITVMAVDNLPCELPKDASEDFGSELINKILPHLLGDDSEGVIRNSTLAENGALTDKYSYLQDYVDGK